jgi:hypothetical protein
MSVFIFAATFIGGSIGDFVMEDPFRPESRRIVTLSIVGSLRGEVCIVLAPAKAVYPICRPNFQKNFKKNQGTSPIGNRQSFCCNQRHANFDSPGERMPMGIAKTV